MSKLKAQRVVDAPSDSSMLLQAIDQVIYRIPFGQIKRVAEQLRKAMMSKPRTPPAKRRESRHCHFSLAGKLSYLTLREAQCVYLILQGKTYPKIGELLGISHRSVEYYMANARSRMGCVTRSELLQRIERSDFLERYTLHNLFSEDEQARMIAL